MHAGLKWCTWPKARYAGPVWCTWNGAKAVHAGLQTRNSHTLLDVLEKKLIIRLMLCVFIGLEKSILRNY